MSRSALAEKAGLGQSQNVYRYETNERHLRGEQLARIADTLGVSLDYLIRGTPPKRRRGKAA
jgi:transcriptional regulator with XRE-family HTH domain